MIVIEDKLGIKDQVIQQLKTVYDPEIPVDVYELGLIYEFESREDGTAKIIMTLTAPGCPVAGDIITEVQKKIGEIDGVQQALVELTFDPAWDRNMMSEEAKLELGFL